MVAPGFKTAFSNHCNTFLTHGTSVVLLGACSPVFKNYLDFSNFESKCFSVDALKEGSQEYKDLEVALSKGELLVVSNAGSLTGEPLSLENL